MGSTHTLAQAFGSIFKGEGAGNPGIRILDYGHPATFADLWQDGLKAETHPPSSILVLCGANPPRAAFDFLNRPGMPPVDVSQHFSAYSWAAAFRLINPLASARIVIIESTPQSQVQGAGPDLWPVSGVAGLCFPSLNEILEAIKLPPPPALSTGEKGMLRGVIQQHLLPNPEDHHKMGNIVGALMLSPEQQTGTEILGALFHALEPDTKFEGRVELPPVDENLTKRVEKGPPFILFDDMGSLWKPFIRRWIPEDRLHTPPVNANSRKALAERIKALAAEPVQRRRLKASDFGVANIADGEPFALLLDLRLFAGDQRDEEVEFVSQLEEAAQSVASAKHLKWPTIWKAEISEGMKAWYEKQTFSPAFRKTRSWLPRLISLIDSTLPVVIFSSTQDPEVLREFRGYGNIITDFSKPMFRGVMGEAKEWAGAATLAFEKALHSALKISSTRTGLRALCRSFEPDEEAKKTGDAPARVEIFIDESGTASQERFALGAVVLISGAAAFDHAIYREAATQGGANAAGLWGLDDVVAINNLRRLPDEALWRPKGKDVQTGADGTTDHNCLLNLRLQAIEALVARQGGQLFACSLLSKERPDPSSIAGVKHPFHRYRDMLTRLLEAILFHVAPVVQAIERGAQICIDAATAKNDADTWNVTRLRQDFGAEEIQEPGIAVAKCRTLGNSHVLPIVSGLLLRNGREGWAGKVVRARAAQLSDFGQCSTGTLFNQKRLDPKPLHYLADWMAHFTWDERDWREVPNIPALNKWFTTGFRQMDGDELRTQLQCHRRWSQAARIAAIKGWANIKLEPDDSDRFALTPRTAGKAARWMEQLTGDELATLFHTEKPV